MERKSGKRFAANALICVLFCLSLSLLVLLTDPFFTFFLLEDSAVQVTREYLGYVFLMGALPEVFTPNEARHMRDVAWLLRSVVLVFVLCSMLLIRWVQKGEWERIGKAASVFFAGCAGIAMLVPFDIVFRWFHVLFFPQGNWMFPADSTLIQFYPQEFFARYAAAWLAHAVLVSVLIWQAGKVLGEGRLQKIRNRNH